MAIEGIITKTIRSGGSSIFYHSGFQAEINIRFQQILIDQGNIKRKILPNVAFIRKLYGKFSHSSSIYCNVPDIKLGGGYSSFRSLRKKFCLQTINIEDANVFHIYRNAVIFQKKQYFFFVVHHYRGYFKDQSIYHYIKFGCTSS